MYIEGSQNIISQKLHSTQSANEISNLSEMWVYNKCLRRYIMLKERNALNNSNTAFIISVFTILTRQ